VLNSSNTNNLLTSSSNTSASNIVNCKESVTVSSSRISIDCGKYSCSGKLGNDSYCGNFGLNNQQYTVPHSILKDQSNNISSTHSSNTPNTVQPSISSRIGASSIPSSQILNLSNPINLSNLNTHLANSKSNFNNTNTTSSESSKGSEMSCGEDKDEIAQQKHAASTQCKNLSCAFFGSMQTEGYCSVCYKNLIKSNSSRNDISNSSTLPTLVPSSKTGLPNNLNIASNTTALAEQLSQTLNNETKPIQIIQNNTSSKSSGIKTGFLQTDSPGSSIGTSPQKPKKRKCALCKKKVGLTGFNCRCGKLYCTRCRFPTAHQCTYDYQTEGKAKLQKDLPAVGPDKVTRF